MAKEQMRDSLELIWRLSGERESLYLVGGTVRDMLLRREEADCDIVGDIDPMQLATGFASASGGTVVAIGERFGTARVVTRHGVFDFSALRGERIHDDLGERDIPFNAMAYPFGTFIRNGFEPDAVIDPFGGRDDLIREVVRALSERNLVEDPARIFRIFRFASAYGFEIDGETMAMAKRNAHLLTSLPGERVRDELFHTFRGPFFNGILKNTDLFLFLSVFTANQVDGSLARRRLKRIIRCLEAPSYEGVREVYFREISGERRAIDNLYLLSIFWDGGEDSLAGLLSSVFCLSRKEKRMLSKISAVMKEKLFPPRGASPINPDAYVDAGGLLPHLVLFADGLNTFGNRRSMVKKTIRYYLENQKLIEKRILPWLSGKSLYQHLIKRRKNPKETIRRLIAEVLAGAIRSEADVYRYIESAPPFK